MTARQLLDKVRSENLNGSVPHEPDAETIPGVHAVIGSIEAGIPSSAFAELSDLVRAAEPA